MGMHDVKATNFKNRRRLLKSLAVIISLPLYYKFTFAAVSVSLISCEVFTEYVKKLLNFESLNVGMTKRVYNLLQDEPWGINHLQRLVGKSSERNKDILLAQLDEGEHWFLGHLLTTWVTGIYYHDKENTVVSYEHALMHEALKEIRPVPGLSTETFGFWHEPPVKIRHNI